MLYIFLKTENLRTGNQGMTFRFVSEERTECYVSHDDHMISESSSFVKSPSKETNYQNLYNAIESQHF